jgi:hypothetical protein
MGFVVSHPCDKNKNVARMGHPANLNSTQLYRTFLKRVIRNCAASP